MEKIRKSGSALALSLLLAAMGCRQIENPGKIYPQSPTVNDTRSKEIQRDMPPDIPVPRDLMIDTQGNVTFYDAKARVGKWRFKGQSTTVEDVAIFYRERMPQRPYGWSLVNEETRGSGTTMHFQKTSERLDLTISAEDSVTVAVLVLNSQTTR